MRVMLRLLFRSDFKLKADKDNANAYGVIEADADKADVTVAVDAGAGKVSMADEAHVINEAVAFDVAIEANAVD